MGTPLYNTDIIPLTSRPTLTVMDDGDYFVILDTSTGKISKILKTNIIIPALKINYDNTTSELTAENVQAALDELVVNLGSTNTVIESLKGVGWTDENLVDHEERLDTLEGTGEGSVADDIAKYAVKLAKMPDGATAVYSQDAWATTDGWTNISVSGGIATITPSSPTTTARKSISGIGGKTLLMRFRRTVDTSNILRIRGYNGTTFSELFYEKFSSTEWVAIRTIIPLGTIELYIYPDNTDGTKPLQVDWIWIGDSSYLENSLSTEASRIANQLGDTNGVGTKASGTITSNGTNVSDGNTVTIAGKVYTFKTTLTPAEGEVLIGALYTDSLVNLHRAINRSGGTIGVDYQVASPHPLVVSGLGSGLNTLTAKTVGIIGNSITIAKSASTLTLSGSTLTGGTDDVGAKVITQLESSYKGTPKFNGVSFPATAVASADPNTLDDYEEGTWTPTLYGSTTAGSPTYAIQEGQYTKVGRLVTVNGKIALTDLGGIIGTVYVGGLPFVTTSTTGSGALSRIGYMPVLDNLTVKPAGTYGLGIYCSLSNTSHGQISNAQINNNTYFEFTITYII